MPTSRAWGGEPRRCFVRQVIRTGEVSLVRSSRAAERYGGKPRGRQSRYVARQGRLTGTPVYFQPLNDDARAAADDIWNDLTGGARGGMTLKVKGRELLLPRFHNGMARATFWDLCGQMYGPGDYLKIAESVKLLILEDVPQLSRHNFNEAKRFVTLIDALYEARVRLICSAAAEPEFLYMEGDGAFEFERTASRLREMQDKDWGHIEG